MGFHYRIYDQAKPYFKNQYLGFYYHLAFESLSKVWANAADQHQLGD